MNKKLIEVALPLKAINEASGHEKTIRHGHPSSLHLWWARRPLAAARAVIFSQMVDDPSSYLDELRSMPKLLRSAEAKLKARRKVWEEAKKQFDLAIVTGVAPAPGPEPDLDEILAEQAREKLFNIIEDLVKWENTTNKDVLAKANAEIWQSWRRACARNADHPRSKEIFNRNKLPAFHDPFAGGGALPLEAQRLGLESYASDLNPVAVLINKAMIEIPPRFSGRPPINSDSKKDETLLEKRWDGAQGLAEDIRYYGQWMRDEAEKRIGHLYPKVVITPKMVKERPDLKPYEGQALQVISWLWARTVKSPNPAFSNVEVPLVSNFLISAKAGKEAYVAPIVDSAGYHFTVKMGRPKESEDIKRGTKAGGSGSSFLCLMSGTPMPFDYLRTEAKAGRMGIRLMAIVAEGKRGRVYISPTPEHEDAACKTEPKWKPDTDLPAKALGFRVQEYGMTKWSDLFTPRQLVDLTTFSDLVVEVHKQIRHDAALAGFKNDETPLREGGLGALAYADAVCVYLSFAINKQADLGNNLCRWEPIAQCPRQLFGRQAIPMVWDFAEGNPLGDSSGSWIVFVDGIVKAFTKAFEHVQASALGTVKQADAGNQDISLLKVISTDPPYYDNIGYADLSDFFYVWLRPSLKAIFPEIFATLAVPKTEELVATPHRHGGKEKAEHFFLDGMTKAMHRLSEQAHPAFPVTIYYAFKQSETALDVGTASTGWETFLAAVIRAGFAITGTWPMRTENSSRMVGQGTNALASSIVLVCNKRALDAPTVTRREFVSALKKELPEALLHLQAGNVAPVDLAQSAIGPGMAIYTRHATVLDATGKEMTVREALSLINQTLDEVLAEQEGDFDPDSRWALAWFEQYGFDDGEYGVAETLSKAKNTSVNGLQEAGILQSAAGKVRLYKPNELPADWDPETDPRLTTWEMVHHLIRVQEAGGDPAAAVIVGKLGVKAETARELCYRLYTVCERKKRTTEALGYNGLVQSWPELIRLSREQKVESKTQDSLF